MIYVLRYLIAAFSTLFWAWILAIQVWPAIVTVYSERIRRWHRKALKFNLSKVVKQIGRESMENSWRS